MPNTWMSRTRSNLDCGTNSGRRCEGMRGARRTKVRPASFYKERRFAMTDTMWKCEQLRAGTVYNRVMFNTRAEAEQFAEQMAKVEPDLFWKIEAVPAKAIWN